MITTLGRELVRENLPDKYKEYADTVLDKKAIVNLMTMMAKDDPDAYVDALQKINDVGQAVVSTYGRDASLAYSDMKRSTPVKNLNKQLRALVNSTLDNTKLTIPEKEERIKALGYKYSQKVEDAVFRDHDSRKTALASQINSGSRGNKTQLMQLQFGNMLMKDALNRDMPYLMLDSYISGSTPMGYWVSSSSGRKGFYDVQAATGQAGYLGKQVTAATHKTTIEKADCGTDDTGIPYPADDVQNVGAVLLRPFHKHPAGSIVDENMVSEADDGEEMILRSPNTCKCKTGICARCNGLDESGKFPGVGEYVPLNAARSFVEAVTQSSVGSKHSGGMGGRKYTDPEGEDQPTGFRSLERMFMAPENFPGGAILSKHDGVVGAVKKAPQGGNYINVGTETIYASPERTVTVKPGDKIYAGDVLTNGVPNPRELVDLKGLGAGRKYFTTQLDKILKKQGWGTARRNLEAFTRSMISRVEITDPEGYRSYLPGDSADYNSLVSNYKPREGSVTTTADKAVDKYLEKPVLFYSVGTRVTPDIAKELKKYDFNTVTVFDKEPQFSAKFLRPAAVLQSDENWLPRLAGERLRDGLFDAARKEVTDPYTSTSYVNKIVASPFKLE